MFGQEIKTGLTLSKVIGGLSKTLNLANQIIPLYKEAIPVVNNAKSVFSILKDLNKSPAKKTINTKPTNLKTTFSNPPKKDTYNLSKPSNNPRFFL